MENGRGGKRAGAGRPKGSVKKDAKITRTFRLSPWAVQFLAEESERRGSGVSQADVIEAALKMMAEGS